MVAKIYISQIYALAVDFKTRHHLRILASTTFHPNSHVQHVPFLPYTLLVSLLTQLHSLSVYTVPFPACLGAKDRGETR